MIHTCPNSTGRTTDIVDVARHTGGAWLRHSREHSRAPGMLVGALGLRGGCDEAAAAEPPAGFAAQLYVALKENKSLDPNDHPTSLQWVLAGEERTGCTTCGRAVPAPAPLHRNPQGAPPSRGRQEDRIQDSRQRRLHQRR